MGRNDTRSHTRYVKTGAQRAETWAKKRAKKTPSGALCATGREDEEDEEKKVYFWLVPDNCKINTRNVHCVQLTAGSGTYTVGTTVRTSTHPEEGTRTETGEDVRTLDTGRGSACGISVRKNESGSGAVQVAIVGQSLVGRSLARSRCVQRSQHLRTVDLPRLPPTTIWALLGGTCSACHGAAAADVPTCGSGSSSAPKSCQYSPLLHALQAPGYK